MPTRSRGKSRVPRCCTIDSMPLVEKDGRLYGPGTYDMKGGLVNMVFALRALQALGLTPEVVPIAFINSDE